MNRVLIGLVGLALVFAAPIAGAALFTTYVTGADGPSAVVFRVTFDPAVAYSATVAVAVTETRGEPDGIDFIPGTGDTEVAVGLLSGKIAHYNVLTGLILGDYVVDTSLVAVPPAAGGTRPSTIKTTGSHIYYVENQFGFAGTTSHRIMRVPLAGGPEEVVFDGAAAGAGGLINFEGIEIEGGRLYFFSADPAAPGSARALHSIGLAGGVWDSVPPSLHIGGLFSAGDGSDELDFDPGSGAIFGTNIVNGEVIGWDLAGPAEIISPAVPPPPQSHFIDGDTIGSSIGALTLLARSVDGIRSTGTGYLVFVGRGGVIGSIDIAGVLADGADDGDIIPLYDILVTGKPYIFDDLTPLTAPVILIPEPATLALLALGVLGLWQRGRASAHNTT